MAAARFIRFFSRRQAKHQASSLNDDHNHSSSNGKFLPHLLNGNGKIHSIGKHQSPIPIKNGLVCTIVFLDGDDVNFEVDVSVLFDYLFFSSLLFDRHSFMLCDMNDRTKQRTSLIDLFTYSQVDLSRRAYS
jgi:hypothetical protein